jgi:hypothetical protein
VGKQLTTAMRHPVMREVAQRRSRPAAAPHHPHTPRGVVVAQATHRCRRATCATLRHPARRGGGAGSKASCQHPTVCAEVVLRDASTGLSSLGSPNSGEAVTAIAIRSSLGLASP